MTLTWLLLVAASYLIGALPVGWMVARLVGGVDIRQHGSGNVGAANVQRTLGWGASAVVMAADVAKGAIAVALARALLVWPEAEIVAALAAVAGHNWSVFLGFRGGRGVSTSLGALTVMSPAMGLVAVFLAVTIIGFSRYVSLATVVGAPLLVLVIAISVALGREPLAYLIYSLIAVIVLLIRHRDNIRRLMAGQERKLGQPAQRGSSLGHRKAEGGQ